MKLQELKKAPNSDSKPDAKKLTKMSEGNQDIKDRNKQILKAYEKGYSQHMIAKVLELNQATVQRIIQRNK